MLKAHRLILIVAFGCALLTALSETAKADPIVTRVTVLFESDPVYVFEGKRRPITVVELAGTTDSTLAYTMSPTRDNTRLSESYTLVGEDLIDFQGAAKASWLAANSQGIGKQLKPYYYAEWSATQLAIWSWTNSRFDLNSKTVPQRRIRLRARELRRATNQATGPFVSSFTSLNLELDVVKATYNSVILEASLRTDAGVGLEGREIAITWDGNLADKKTTDDRGVVTLDSRRPHRRVEAAANWTGTYRPGNILMPTEGGDAIVVLAEEFEVELHREIVVDPKELTSGLDLVHQEIADILSRALGPWGEQFTATLILLLLAIPYLTIVIGLIIKGARLLKRRTD